jgi:hypothetical protein
VIVDGDAENELLEEGPRLTSVVAELTVVICGEDVEEELLRESVVGREEMDAGTVAELIRTPTKPRSPRTPTTWSRTPPKTTVEMRIVVGLRLPIFCLL